MTKSLIDQADRELMDQKSSAQASPQATVPPFNIHIFGVEHRHQRYDTCGDYSWSLNQYERPECLNITVSELPDRREMILIAIHELCEWAICQTKRISNEEIDRFDLQYQPDVWAAEPGDDPSAPYYHAHQIASGIERILAAEMGVDWLSYEQHIKELSHE